MPTKTEQHSYPHQHHLHRIEASVNKFYENQLTLDEQYTAAEEIMVAANRLLINVQDAANRAKNSDGK